MQDRFGSVYTSQQKNFQAESGMDKGPFTVGLPHRQGMGLSDGVSGKPKYF